jgi:hypothetical protein
MTNIESSSQDLFLMTEVGYHIDPSLAEKASRALLTPAKVRTPQQQEDLDRWNNLMLRIKPKSDVPSQQ